jgi:hypothetical protein
MRQMNIAIVTVVTVGGKISCFPSVFRFFCSPRHCSHQQNQQEQEAFTNNPQKQDPQKQKEKTASLLSLHHK